MTKGRVAMPKRKKLSKLEQDAAAAKKAGLSYGKWRAEQQPCIDGSEKPAPATYGTRVCKQCGKTFALKDKRNRVYCCALCRQMAGQKAQLLKKREQRKKQLEITGRFCEHCGKDLSGADHRRRFCSQSCCKEHRKERLNAIKSYA